MHESGKSESKVTESCPILSDTGTATCRISSMGFSKQEMLEWGAVLAILWWFWVWVLKKVMLHSVTGCMFSYVLLVWCQFRDVWQPLSLFYSALRTHEVHGVMSYRTLLIFCNWAAFKISPSDSKYLRLIWRSRPCTGELIYRITTAVMIFLSVRFLMGYRVSLSSSVTGLKIMHIFLYLTK